MAVSSSTSSSLPPARGWQIPVALVRHVALDPGIIYTAADILLFAGTNTVGLGATIAATGLAAGLKTLSVLQPDFLRRFPKITAIAFDDRTPLRAGALSLLVVGGAALSGGALLPAAASFLFAAANFRMAESISKHHKEEAKKALEAKKPDASDITLMLVKRPDLYLNAGFACAGLMAGGAALFVLPVVATAFGISMHNAITGKPEHAGHPKLITAASGATFAAIGHSNGHGLIAVAHAMNAGVLLEIERRVTPGGFMQIGKDFGNSALKIFGVKKAPIAAPADPVQQSAPAPQAQTFRLSDVSLNSIFGFFARPLVAAPLPANENTVEAEAQSAPALKAPKL